MPDGGADRGRVRGLRTEELDEATVREVRALLDTAFDGRIDDDDWAHSLGGTHLLVRVNGLVAAHASVVPRALDVDGILVLRTGPSHDLDLTGALACESRPGDDW